MTRDPKFITDQNPFGYELKPYHNEFVKDHYPEYIEEGPYDILTWLY
jgi:hypothetical protein